MIRMPLLKARHELCQEKLVDFAFRVYSEPDVEELCLYLQNEYSANINILLWTCWLKTESINLHTHWLDDVLIRVDTVSQLTVGRMHDIRRAIKASGAFTRVQAQSINRHLLDAELTAEKIFLQRLQDLTFTFMESQQGSATLEKDSLSPEFYLSFLEIPKANERADKILSFSRNADVLPLGSLID